MSYSTAWVIGSVKDMSYTAFTIDPDDGGGGAPVTTVEIVGDFYLWHDTNAISLLDEFVVQMTAAGCAGAAAVLTRDRKVKISANAAFAVAWSSDTGLRDLLGYTGNLSGAASYTATNVSPLLWSPAKPPTTDLAPYGLTGIRRPLTFFAMSPSDGSAFAVNHGTRTDQRWSFGHVDTARVFTTADAGGEFATFFDECLAKGYQFQVYPEVTEDPGSTTTATLSGALGPYVYTPSGRAPNWDYRRSRGHEYSDKRADIVIQCRDAPEYT